MYFFFVLKDSSELSHCALLSPRGIIFPIQNAFSHHSERDYDYVFSLGGHSFHHPSARSYTVSYSTVVHAKIIEMN